MEPTELFTWSSLGTFTGLAGATAVVTNTASRAFNWNPQWFAGDLGKRKLSLGQVSAGDFSSAEIVAAAGYPAAPNLYVPGSIHSKYDDILKRLLEGDGGAKRFAPGVPSTFIGNSGPSNWTVEPANTSP